MRTGFLLPIHPHVTDSPESDIITVLKPLWMSDSAETDIPGTPADNARILAHFRIPALT